MVFLRTQRLKKWEIALLIGVACSLVSASALGMEQDALAEQVVRLHVVANSDSEADQALKLKVRDAVLAEVTPYLEGLSREETLEALGGELSAVAERAAEVVLAEGYGYPVAVSLQEEAFPTKRYEDFALPAGDYMALRVQIGEGDGKNWWCVVFPPLCMGSVEEVAGLDDRDKALITGETQGYVVKFKAMELWEKWKARLS